MSIRQHATEAAAGRSALTGGASAKARLAAWSLGVPGRPPNEAFDAAGLAGILEDRGCRHLVTSPLAG